MAHRLLFEIGCEELPARFIPGALQQLEQLAREGLQELRLAHGDIRTLGTPRRLALLVDGLSDKQADSVQEVKGPSERAAFDEGGQPTKAALGFARSQGVPVEELVVKDTPQGRYVFVSKREQGKPAREVLGPWLASLVGKISFPKSMRWADSTRFARPIRWLVALLDEEVVPLESAGLRSGRITRGHRFLSARDVELKSPADYVDRLREAYVIVDQEERRRRIWEQVQAKARELGGSVQQDDGLLTEITYLVEYPTALAGRFDEEMLTLPSEVLTTPMIEHQRYFPVVDGEGKLLPYFIAVANTDDRHASTIVKGNERVLAARLADARFFFNEDRKQPLAQLVPRLEGIVFQERLGSMLAKANRLEALTRRLGEGIGLNPDQLEHAVRAARLCKADLVTQMVYEFPELQGVMGREYARASGEPEAVAEAIYEHILPRHAGDETPATLVGAAVALADRFDTLVGCWAAGLVPTGSQDPYALRRAAMGIVQICLARSLPLSLEEAIRAALEGYPAELVRGGTDVDSTGGGPERLVGEVSAFVRQRLRGLLVEQGCRYDVVDAVLAVAGDQPVVAAERSRSLDGLMNDPLMAEARRAYQRVANLARRADSSPLAADRLEPGAERGLYDAMEAARPGLEEAVTSGRYKLAIEVLASLAPPIDAFFDAVLVMAEDEAVRTNRLALLREVRDFFHRVADFSRLEG